MNEVFPGLFSESAVPSITQPVLDLATGTNRMDGCFQLVAVYEPPITLHALNRTAESRIRLVVALKCDEKVIIRLDSPIPLRAEYTGLSICALSTELISVGG